MAEPVPVEHLPGFMYKAEQALKEYFSTMEIMQRVAVALGAMEQRWHAEYPGVDWRGWIRPAGQYPTPEEISAHKEHHDE